MEWNSIKWRKTYKRVRQLQYKIYDASTRGDVLQVHHLQRIMIDLPQAKLWAVRKVSQDNTGKKTSGVDGIKTLTPTARLNMVNDLSLDGKSDAILRKEIPKGTGQTRPLGIPTIRDRAKQCLALFALEPQWEAKFEPNSYGFRPGRRCQDAIESIHLAINKKAKFVLDADITKCFDEKSHDYLLNKINAAPKINKQIKAWLKAGILEDGKYIFPSKGTPQGGVISPLLSNIALHGMEEFLKSKMDSIPLRTPDGKKSLPKRDRRSSLHVCRYADDFVVMHEDNQVLNEMRKHITEWLGPIGLELNPEKTSICHTLNELNGKKPGFNFLGCYIRSYPVGKLREKKRKQGFRTLIKPAKDKTKDHYKKIKKILRESANIEQLITKVNPIIRGWANYYRHIASKRTFARIDSLIMTALFKWARRKHTNRGGKWLYQKYLKRITTRLRFGFERKTGEDQGKWTWVITHAEIPIVRYTKITGVRSPYDGDVTYWQTNGRNIQRHDSKTMRIVANQGGKCRICGELFTTFDTIEIDHLKPRAHGGSDKLRNLQCVHRECHEVKTRSERTKTEK